MPLFKDYIAGRTAEASIVDDDEFYVRDDSGDTDKRITYAGLKTALDSRYATVTALDALAPRSCVYFNGTASNYVSTPDTAALDIVGSFTLAVRCGFNDWTLGGGNFGTLIGKNFNAYEFIWGNDKPYLEVAKSTVSKTYSPNAAPPLVDGTVYWLKVDFVVNDGAGNSTAKFYYAPDSQEYPTVWTQYGGTQTKVETTAIDTNALALTIGARPGGTVPSTGKFLRGLVLDGSGVTLADWRADVPTDRYRDSTGKVWTMTGSAWSREVAPTP